MFGDAADEAQRRADEADHEREREVQGRQGRQEEAQKEQREGLDEQILLRSRRGSVGAMGQQDGEDQRQNGADNDECVSRGGEVL